MSDTNPPTVSITRSDSSSINMLNKYSDAENIIKKPLCVCVKVPMAMTVTKKKVLGRCQTKNPQKLRKIDKEIPKMGQNSGVEFTMSH